jgi:predicted dehydrogenase/threonine dehydrogenase-like Zn-dependent dehydrogenase
MKQVIQNYKTGEIELVEVPAPICGKNELLIENKNSLISAGTEKLMINLAKKSLLGKAKERPDLVKKVIDKIRTDGLMEAYKQSMARLENPVPLGYSSAGLVKEIGSGVGDFSVGDRVACIGPEYASHAEIISVPKNLCVKIPEEVDFESASFVALGGIALHAVRVSKSEIGDNVAVLGLGLLGQIAVQILKASGCNVFGVDVDESKLELAKKFGADDVSTPEKLFGKYNDFTSGNGFDSVIIFASTKSNQPIEQAAEIARDRGKIIAPGMVNFNLPRKLFYDKELKLIVSRSWGPGVADENYERKCIDYPISYVRWTANRNIKAFLDLLNKGKVNLNPLITHKYKIDNALSAYDMILNKKEKYIGVILDYPELENKLGRKILNDKRQFSKKNKVNVGLIGVGLFVKGTMAPILKDIKNVNIKGIAASKGFTLEGISQKLRSEYKTTDYKEILNDKDIDAVIVAVPHNLHSKFIIESLNAKKDVFSEKPLCLNKDQLEEIIESYSQSNNRLMVGFNRRFSPFSTFLKEKIDKKEPKVINCRVNVGYLPKDIWVHDKEIGGGNIIGEVCHFVDLIQYFTDSLPFEVSAFSVSSKREDVFGEDNIIINLKMEDGSVGNIVYTTLGNKSFPRERIEIFSNNKVGVIDNFKSVTFFDGSKRIEKRGLSLDRGHKKEYESFIESVLGGKDSPVSFKDYVATTLATFKISESLRTGQTQRIDLEKYL